MDTVTASGSIEELKEASNLIIYIVGLVLLIIWRLTVDVFSASTLEAQSIGETGGERASTTIGAMM